MEGLSHTLSQRAELAGIALPAALRDALETYFEVLSRWNVKMNLTSLTNGDEAIDRLLVEPLAAAAAFPQNIRLMDLGSGGGSPALPLALALNASELIMVESRERKAAFLREAARATGISARVEAVRFEDLSSQGLYSRSMDAVSMRAVRMDDISLNAAATFLRPDGRLALFVTAGAALTPPDQFLVGERRQLIGTSELITLMRDVSQ